MAFEHACIEKNVLYAEALAGFSLQGHYLQGTITVANDLPMEYYEKKDDEVLIYEQGATSFRAIKARKV